MMSVRPADIGYCIFLAGFLTQSFAWEPSRRLAFFD